jgi:hypothetical protein
MNFQNTKLFLTFCPSNEASETLRVKKKVPSVSFHAYQGLIAWVCSLRNHGEGRTWSEICKVPSVSLPLAQEFDLSSALF